MNTVLISHVSASASSRNISWWMESNIKDYEISYTTEKELKDKLEGIIKEHDYALNKKIKFNNMYMDMEEGAKTIGYTCNIMVEVQSSYDYSWKKGYFELWITLKNISDFQINTKDNK